MDKSRLISAAMSAVFVLLWGLPRLLTIWFSEPPPTRERKMLALGNAIASTAMGGFLGILASGWAADFFNGLVEKFIGVNPHTSDTVAGVFLAVVIIHLGPAVLAKAEKMLGKAPEATP